MFLSHWIPPVTTSQLFVRSANLAGEIYQSLNYLRKGALGKMFKKKRIKVILKHRKRNGCVKKY